MINYLFQLRCIQTRSKRDKIATNLCGSDRSVFTTYVHWFKTLLIFLLSMINSSDFFTGYDNRDQTHYNYIYLITISIRTCIKRQTITTMNQEEVTGLD